MIQDGAIHRDLNIVISQGQRKVEEDIENEIERVQKRVSYAEPPHLFRNLGGGKFTEVTAQMGKPFAAPKVARSAAYADIDNDGFFRWILNASAESRASRHVASVRDDHQ